MGTFFIIAPPLSIGSSARLHLHTQHHTASRILGRFPDRKTFILFSMYEKGAWQIFQTKNKKPINKWTKITITRRKKKTATKAKETKGHRTIQRKKMWSWTLAMVTQWHSQNWLPAYEMKICCIYVRNAHINIHPDQKYICINWMSIRSVFFDAVKIYTLKQDPQNTTIEYEPQKQIYPNALPFDMTVKFLFSVCIRTAVCRIV